MVVWSVGIGAGGRRAFALGWALFGVGLTGCESDGAGTPIEIFCSGMCERAAQCGGRSARACQQDCEASPGSLNDFQTDFVREFADCIGGLSCTVFFEEKSFDTCWAGARDGFAPDQKTRNFCNAYTHAWFECGSSYFRDECERDWAVFAGETLDRVAKCQGVACTELDACVDAALGLAE